MQVRTPCREDSLEEGITTPSTVLASGIPWIEEAGGLQSIESQRVRCNWSDWAHMHAGTFVYTFLCGHMFSFLLDIYLEMELVAPMVTLYLKIWETSNCFPHWLHHFTFHQQCMKVKISSNICQYYLFPPFKNYSHRSVCEWCIVVVLICNIPDELNIFPCACFPFPYLLCRITCLNSLAIFELTVSSLFSCRCSLHILEIKPLSGVWFANVSSRCLFFFFFSFSW